MKEIINESQRSFLGIQFKKKSDDLRNLNNLLNNKYNSLEKEIGKIDGEWNKVVKRHKKPLRLVILAEAPLSSSKYFYNHTGVFLNGLKNLYNLKKNCMLPDKMLESGILLLDIYKLPIPAEFYKADTENCLFDSDYFKCKLEHICKEDLIDSKTKFIFRYKALVDKFKDNTVFSEKMKSCNCELFADKETGNFISLFKKERPQEINDDVEKFLNMQ